MPIKQATVFVDAEGVVHIDPMNVTPDGVYVSALRIRRLLRPTEAELGAAVTAALEEAGQVVAHPSSQADWSTRTRLWVKAMARRSFRQVMHDFAAASVTESDGTVTIGATRNLGTRGGYQSLGQPYPSLSIDAPPAEVGSAVRAALAQSLPRPADVVASDMSDAD